MYSTGDELDGKFVILAGYLKKRVLTSWTIGYFAILSGGILVELNGPKPTVSINISEYELTDGTVAVGKFHSFCLVKNIKEKIYLRAASEEDASKWVSVLEKFKKDTTIPFIINEEPALPAPSPSVINSFPEPTIKVNNFGIVLDANQPALSLFDCSLENIMGQTLKSFLLLDDKSKAENFMDLFAQGHDKPEFTLTFEGGERNQDVVMSVMDNGDCYYLKFNTISKNHKESILLEMDDYDGMTVLSDDETTRKKSPGASAIRFLPRLNILRNKKEITSALSPRSTNSPSSARSCESDQETLSLSPRLRNEYLDPKKRLSDTISTNVPTKKRRPRTLSLKQTTSIECSDDILIPSTIRYISSSPGKSVEAKSFTHGTTQQKVKKNDLQFATAKNPVKEIEGVLHQLDSLKKAFEEGEASLRASISSIDTTEANINFVKNSILATKVKELEEKLKKYEKVDPKRKRKDKRNAPPFSEVVIREKIISNLPLYDCIVDNWNCMMETIHFDKLIRIEIDLIKSCINKWKKLPYSPTICHCLNYELITNLNNYSLRIFSTRYSENLKSYLLQKGTFPLELNEIYSFLKDIVSGLKLLFSNQIIHGNLNTDNIFVSRNTDGSVDHLVLYNYGRSLWPIPILNSRSSTFLPPECNFTETSPVPCTAQTDIWFLGLIISELLTGMPPTKEAVVKPSLPPLPASYGILCGLYESCTKLKPSDRITFQEFEDKLNSIHK